MRYPVNKPVMMRGSIFKSAVKADRGSAAVEFALLLPFLLTIIFFIFECGWMATTQLLLNQAVFHGARSAVTAREWMGDNPVDFALYSTKNAFWIGELDDSDISIKILDANVNAPRRIEVIITNYSYAPLTGFFPPAMLPENMGAKAVMEFL